MQTPDMNLMKQRMDLALQTYGVIMSHGGTNADIVFTTACLVDGEEPVVVIGVRPRPGHPLYDPMADPSDVFPLAACFNDPLSQAIRPYGPGVSVPMAQLDMPDDVKPHAEIDAIDLTVHESQLVDEVDEFLRELGL